MFSSTLAAVSQSPVGPGLNSATVLIVDDEPQIRRVLRTTLTSHGYAVIEARSGDQALELIRGEHVDLILLDLSMPGRSGLEIGREIRRSGYVPIIMLTVRSSERDKVQALDAGAYDYVVKPFGSEELMARVRATLRRFPPSECLPSFVSRDLTVDFEKRRAMLQGQPVHLTPKEFDLLRYLIANRGRSLGHRRLLQAVWGPDYGDETEYLRVFINQLRKKIEPEAHDPRYIHTEPWVGYRFEAPSEKAAGTSPVSPDK
jgi:two-component system KDP operon response regulator KdpE